MDKFLAILLLTGVLRAQAPVIGEVPSGPLNGVNHTFKIAQAANPPAVAVYRNGLRLKAGPGYDFTFQPPNTIVFQDKSVPQFKDLLQVDYFTGASLFQPIACAPPTSTVLPPNVYAQLSPGNCIPIIAVPAQGLTATQITAESFQDNNNPPATVMYLFTNVRPAQ